jgi:hypothetical protein
MIDDPEIKAIEGAYASLKDLDDEAKLRVIKWLTDKFSLNITSLKNNQNPVAPENSRSSEEKNISIQDLQLSSFTQLSELFAHIDPKTDGEKALVVGAYLQEVQGQPELTGRLINDELKHLGHGASNITTTISFLISKKPNLMIQTRKEGKSQQAQKKYRVTTEGFKLVKEMIKNKTIINT